MSNSKIAIIKADIFNPFPSAYAFELKGNSWAEELKEKYEFKRITNKNSIDAFILQLHITSCDIIRTAKDPNESYNKFLKKLSQNYHSFFPNKTSSPWITNSITKSLKLKQKLYEKFLKNHTVQNENNCKTIGSFLKL